LGGSQFKVSLEENLVDLISTNKLGVMVHTCNLTFMGGIDTKIPGRNARLYLKI
jgi:hypothetical protein